MAYPISAVKQREPYNKNGILLKNYVKPGQSEQQRFAAVRKYNQDLQIVKRQGNKIRRESEVARAMSAIGGMFKRKKK